MRIALVPFRVGTTHSLMVDGGLGELSVKAILRFIVYPDLFSSLSISVLLQVHSILYSVGLQRQPVGIGSMASTKGYH